VDFIDALAIVSSLALDQIRLEAKSIAIGLGEQPGMDTEVSMRAYNMVQHIRDELLVLNIAELSAR
jgi:hypothetical protein